MLGTDDWSPLTEIASQDALVLDIMAFTWSNASTISTAVLAVRNSINKIIPILLVVFKGTDAVTLVRSIGILFPKLSPEVSLRLPFKNSLSEANSNQALPQSPKWLNSLVATLRKVVANRPTTEGRAAYTQLAGALLQAYPETCPSLLFRDDDAGNADSKPFSYLFISLLLIDVRSSFPSLLAQLNSTEYPAISQRLAAAFDVISSFIGFLVRCLDEDTTQPLFSLPPDLLLKLRKDIAETISLTIEYLRDRWDASIAGARGLHPSARAGTAATSEGTRLTITWESIKDDVNADPLILAGIRALAIWIREDENENLRNESGGLMDMFIDLYKTSTLGTLDFRYPILMALEGILVTEDGVDNFLGQDGWPVVFDDLKSILLNTRMSEQAFDIASASSEAARGIEIVRVLLVVLDHSSTLSTQEDWMTAITTTASLKIPSSIPNSLVLELQIAMLQLSTASLSKAAGGMQKRYVTSNAALLGLAQQLETLVNELDDQAEVDEFKSLLEDVKLDLENLKS